jgi:DNA-binding transcriptional MerR regulator
MSAPYERENRPRLRIGELSRRSGVRADTLRAWERRYGLLRPERTEGGFRLYGAEDELRVRTMKSLIDSGVSASEAARLASATSAAEPPRERSAAPLSDETLERQTRRLRDALEDFDDVAANEVLDEVLAAFTIDALAERVVLPVLREIGNRWESGEASVAQEHFATGVLRARMLSAARNWGAGI